MTTAVKRLLEERAMKRGSLRREAPEHERHPYFKNHTRQEMSRIRRKQDSKNYPLLRIDKRKDGFYAVYENGEEYRHDTFTEAKQMHGVKR